MTTATTINANEKGISFALNVNYPLNGATTLTIEFTRPDGTTFTGTPTISATPLDASAQGQGTFAANQYALYPFVQGDLTKAGEYIVRLRYDNPPTMGLHSDPASFTVNP